MRIYKVCLIPGSFPSLRKQKIFDCVADLIGQRDFGVTTDIYRAGSTSIGAVRLDVMLSEIFEGVVLHNSALKKGYEIRSL